VSSPATRICEVCHQETVDRRYCEKCGVSFDLYNQIEQSENDVLAFLAKDPETPTKFLSEYNLWRKKQSRLEDSAVVHALVAGDPLLIGIAYALCAEFLVSLARKLVHRASKRKLTTSVDYRRELEAMSRRISRLEDMIARRDNYWLAQAYQVVGDQAKFLSPIISVPLSVRLDQSRILRFLMTLGWTRSEAESKATDIIKLLCSRYQIEQPS
jgi:hypothetical protein